jgi:hypothetical protein
MGIVEEYQPQFLALLCRCDGLSAGHAMSLFMAGLGEPMTSDVEMQPMSLTRMFECRTNVAPSAPMTRYPPRSRQTLTGAPSQASSMTYSTTAALATNTVVSSPAATTCSRFRRLLPEDMAEKRKKGE